MENITVSQSEVSIQEIENIADKLFSIVSEINGQSITDFRNSLNPIKQHLFDRAEEDDRLRVVAMSRLSVSELQVLTRNEIWNYIPGLHDIKSILSLLASIRE